MAEPPIADIIPDGVMTDEEILASLDVANQIWLQELPVVDPAKWRETDIGTHQDTDGWTHFRFVLVHCRNNSGRGDRIQEIAKFFQDAGRWCHLTGSDYFRFRDQAAKQLYFNVWTPPFAPTTHAPLYLPFYVQHWVAVPNGVDRLQVRSFEESVLSREAPMEAYADWLLEQGWEERWQMVTQEIERAGRQANGSDAGACE